jgi:8-oxo-dGTP diphosphatase
MKLRVMAGALICNGEDCLIMKRAENRKFAPGLWGLVGGHAEPEEINDPKTACLREVFEETGINADRLENLLLRYIACRQAKDEIRIHYFFTAEVKSREYEDKTDEGMLFWIPQCKLTELSMSFTLKKAIEHFLSHDRNSMTVYLGGVTEVSGMAVMRWIPLTAMAGMADLMPLCLAKKP